MKALSAILLAMGAALWAYALTFSPYTDEALFNERYMALSVGQSEEYWKLRDEMLTPKFQLEDYGITFILLALLVFLVARQEQPFLRAPISRGRLIAFAVGLPALTVAGFVLDIFLAIERGEFPHWSDSMGIPILGIPAQFFFLLIWSIAHLGFLRDEYQPDTLLTHAFSRSNWWLLFISAITAILTFESLYFGQYWYAVPGILWLYYYLSLGALRQEVTAV